MFRYLKAAFWAAPDMPGLGRVPINVLAFAGLMILGFGHPGFWLLALALEGAWLYALSNNERFRNVIDAEQAQLQAGAVDAVRENLALKLTAAAKARHSALRERCVRIGQLEHESQTDEFVIESNREALEKLALLQLKLLVAQQTLQSLDSERAQQELQARLAGIERELRSGALSNALRESKQATQAILAQRLANLARREETLEEIESDLTRIESQIDLALDNAGLRGKSETISANIQLASQLLDESSGSATFSPDAFERKYSSEME